MQLWVPEEHLAERVGPIDPHVGQQLRRLDIAIDQRVEQRSVTRAAPLVSVRGSRSECQRQRHRKRTDPSREFRHDQSLGTKHAGACSVYALPVRDTAGVLNGKRESRRDAEAARQRIPRQLDRAVLLFEDQSSQLDRQAEVVTTGC